MTTQKSWTRFKTLFREALKQRTQNAIPTKKKRKGKPSSSSSSSSSSLSLIFNRFPHIIFISDLSLSLSFFLYLERKTTNKNKKQKEKDVNPGKEEVDEGFQEASAGSTCWYQWSPSRQQHHALERCYFWVPFFSFLSFFLLFPCLISNFCFFFVDLMILLGMEVGNSDSCFFFSFLITLYNFIFCFLCY